MASQYSTDTDLVQFMPDIRTHGINDFDNDHLEAKNDIDRIIEVKWFQPRLRQRFGKDIELLDGDTDFDPELMLNALTQLKKASVYRALSEYILPKLSQFQNADGDAFLRRADFFAEKFTQEMDRVLAVGIDYDWDESGTIDDDEDRVPATSFRVGRG